MTTLKEQIMADFVTAFKAGDSVKKNALGNIKSKIAVLEKTQAVDDAVIISLISKEISSLTGSKDFDKLSPALKESYTAEANALSGYIPSLIPQMK